MDKLQAVLTARSPALSAHLNAGDTLTVGVGMAGTKGAVYTPHITDDGILSWTNDGGRDNPAPVDGVPSACTGWIVKLSSSPRI